MQEIKTIDLTFEQELLVAVYHNNVEKVKWLMEMDYFKPSMIKKPVVIGKVTVPLYWLTICYHYMLRYKEFDDVRWKVDKMLEIWRELYGIEADDLIDLKGCFHSDDKSYITRDIEKWWMGHFNLEDFLRSGAREVDYELYKAICDYDVNGILKWIERGGLPDSKIVDTKGNVRSAISMFRYWIKDKVNYRWGKERVIIGLDVEWLVRRGLEEMILCVLENSIVNRKCTLIETFDGDVDMLGHRDKAPFNPTIELKNKVTDFIHEIDNPGAVLAVFDEGKVFARCSELEYQDIYCYVIKRVLSESKYVRIRIGGYSYRAAEIVLDLVKDQPKYRVYVENLKETSNCDMSEDDKRIKVVCMGKYTFQNDMGIVRQATEYDFKTYGNRHSSHCMVYYYVNNIDTGWYDENGHFCNFYSKDRGLQAITDVIMINGYEDITPATAAICTFTFDSEGDRLYISDAVHKDRRSRTSSQRMLIEKAGIKLLDLTNKKALEKI